MPGPTPLLRPVDLQVPGIQAFITARYARDTRHPFNLSPGADAASAHDNRRILDHTLPTEPVTWLKQLHCSQVHAITTGRTGASAPEADAAYTTLARQPCAVMTADCLPMLVAEHSGKQVAAIHAGWRGLASGIIENTLTNFADQSLHIWLGPCICPQHFQVKEDVRRFYQHHHPKLDAAFSTHPAGGYQLDLQQAARLILEAYHVVWLDASPWCTYQHPEHFFSFRRDGRCGCMASLIWRQ